MCNQYSVSQYDTFVRIGALGNLSQRRLSPAMAQLIREKKLWHIIDVDIKAQIPGQDPLIKRSGAWHRYYQIGEDSVLPDSLAEDLARLGGGIVAYVACPTIYHLNYAEQFNCFCCRIAIEKPLTRDMVAARALVEQNHRNLFPVGHQMFKTTMRQILSQIQNGEMPSTEILGADGFEFNLLEMDDIGGRDIDNAVWDTGWHGFEVIAALFRAIHVDVEFSVYDVKTATYEPTDSRLTPSEYTAARIDGFLDYGWGPVPFVIRVGKGLSVEQKELVIWNRHTHNQHVIPLNESGWEAHYFVLHELVCAENPNMRLSLEDTAQIVQACSEADRRAINCGMYPIGQMPDFLMGGRVSIHSEL